MASEVMRSIVKGTPEPLQSSVPRDARYTTPAQLLGPLVDPSFTTDMLPYTVTNMNAVTEQLHNANMLETILPDQIGDILQIAKETQFTPVAEPSHDEENPDNAAASNQDTGLENMLSTLDIERPDTNGLKELVHMERAMEEKLTYMFDHTLQPTAMQDVRLLCTDLIKFGERINFPVGHDLHGLVKLLITAALKHVDHTKVYTMLQIKHEGISYIELQKQCSLETPPVSTNDSILLLIRNIHFDPQLVSLLQESTTIMTPLEKTIHVIKTFLFQKTGMPDQLTIDEVLRVIFLRYVKTSHLTVISSYLQSILPQKVYNDTLPSELLLALMNVSHNERDTAIIFHTIIQDLKISDSIHTGVLDLIHNAQHMAKIYNAKKTQEKHKKLRLREKTKLRQLQAQATDRSEADDGVDVQTGSVSGDNPSPKLHMFDTYQHWVQKTRLPPSMTERRRLTAYLLMCLEIPPLLEDKDALRGIDIVFQDQVAELIAINPVRQPEQEPLKILLSMITDIGKPTEEFWTFKDRCLRHLGQHKVNAMSLKRIFNLYVIAYLPRSVQDSLWGTFYGSDIHYLVRNSYKEFKQCNTINVNWVTAVLLGIT